MRRAPSPAVVAALAAAAVAACVVAQRQGLSLQQLDQLELLTLDLRFAARGARPPGDEVVLVVFDDATFAGDATLFERREGWARVLAAVSAAHPRAIGVDAFFSRDEELLSPGLGTEVRAFAAAHPPAEGEAAALLGRVAQEGAGDEALARAISEAGNVVLAMHVGAAGAGTQPGPAPARARFGQSAPGAGPAGMSRQSAAGTRPAGLKLSLPALVAAAHTLGFVTVEHDASSTVRELPLGLPDRAGIVAPLALQLTAARLGVPRSQLAFLGDEVRLGARSIPLNDRGGIWLNFRGPPGTFPTFSALDLVEGRVDPAALAGRVVILGIDYFGHDTVRTPFGEATPGVELHATAVDNLLRGDPLRRAPWAADAAVTLLVGLLVAACFDRRLGLRPTGQLAGAAAMLASYTVVSHGLFARTELWLGVVGPLAAGIAATGAGLATAYASEGRARRVLRQAFAHYLGDEVIGELLADPRALRLGGERRVLSVLFADIRGFTTIAEGLSPLDTVAFLNRFLAPMTEAVLRERGYLDKYVGDAVMAVFGAPVASEDHTDRALACALTMHRELAALQGGLGAGPRLSMGIGINTGEVVAGNIGSAQRFDYTVIGDAVNLASRIEGLTRIYGVFCLVGEGTRRAAGEGFRFREVDRVEVKGKSEPAAIFELLSGPGGAVASYRELQLYEAGLAAWQRCELAAARTAFQAFAVANPDDPVVQGHLTRLAALPEEAPADFRPVRVHATKK